MLIKRRIVPERPDWQQTANNIGYGYYKNEDGSFAWNDAACYELDFEAVQSIGLATETLFHMSLETIGKAISTPDGMTAFGIPAHMQDYVRHSWNTSRNHFLIGRFDLAWNGGNLKLIEFNADTPATLPESTSMQDLWHRDHPSLGENIGLDESMISSQIKRLMEAYEIPETVHVIPYPDNLEDATHAVFYSRWIREAGGRPIIAELKDLCVNSHGQFVHQGEPVSCALKMYPWELMFSDPGHRHLAGSQCAFINPAWTSLLSNKYLLVALWNDYPGHPLLLQSGMSPEGMTQYAAKPIHARGGENVSLHANGVITETCDGTYGNYPTVYQEKTDTKICADAPVHTSIGSWIVGSDGHFAGITMREDRHAIIRHTSPITPCIMANPKA